MNAKTEKERTGLAQILTVALNMFKIYGKEKRVFTKALTIAISILLFDAVVDMGAKKNELMDQLNMCHQKIKEDNIDRSLASPPPLPPLMP